MESTNVNTASTTNSQAIQPVEQRKPNDTNKYLCKIECSIRRKPDTIGLPGQDPAERIYRIGASIDSKTKGNLKGISGELETKFMPEIVGIGHNDVQFRKVIEEYWSSISIIVPHDETYQREHEKGLILNIQFHVIGEPRKAKFDSLTNAEEKIAHLNNLLLTYTKDPSTGQPTNKALAELSFESIPDYLLLNYCLKYNKVANSINDIHKSPKIDFYIFEKAVATKTQLNIIELRQKAMTIYQGLEAEPNKIDAILLEFKEDITKYDSVIDKLLRIDELYTAQPIENMKKFIDVASDSNWETKYLINNALKQNLLRSPANTSAIYYNEIYLGISVNDAALTLNSDESGKTIKANLEKELSK